MFVTVEPEKQNNHDPSIMLFTYGLMFYVENIKYMKCNKK